MLTNVLEMCALEIVLSKTLHGANVAVIRNNKLENEFIKKLHESYNVKMFGKDYNVPLNITPDVYIVHSDDKNHFENIIANLKYDCYRNSNALFILVLPNIREEDLPSIFKILWSHHVIHVLVTIKDADEDASIYSYLPYVAGRCGRDYNHTIKMGQCQGHAATDVVEKLRVYDKPNLENCTFNILAHHYPPLVFSDLNPVDTFAVGIERYLVQLLLEAEHMSTNFTFVPEIVEFGGITNNFTVTGIMKKLHENEVDLLFGGFSLNNRRALFFDFISIHLAFEDIFIPVTPNSELVQRWRIIYMIFEYRVWLLLLVAILICSALLCSIDSLSKCKGNSFSKLLKLFGNATQNVVFKRRENLSENVIIINWLWFVFLVTCYYNTRLTSYSTYRTYEPQINEYISLQKYNLTPCFSRDIMTFLKKSETPIIHEQYLDMESCKTADLALDEIVKSSSKYTVTIYYKYLWWAAQHPKEKSRVHVMHENMYKTHYAIFFKRGFPLLQRFVRRMSRIVECGFVHAIKGRFPNDVRYASDVSGAFEVRFLTLYDLILPFSILAVGHLIALVVFIIEVLYKTNKIFVMFLH
ncbi:uncharacterized protein LOC134741348 [Cydia strobilella]|uniref:uncharacterized protein LOC134741348 n=1 Tax=Cydia strobilella TaxID=1100964 RepID=UPI003003D770